MVSTVNSVALPPGRKPSKFATVYHALLTGDKADTWLRTRAKFDELLLCGARGAPFRGRAAAYR